MYTMVQKTSLFTLDDNPDESRRIKKLYTATTSGVGRGMHRVQVHPQDE